jgi:glutamate/tyrosine decarboxylase-like PLP-dependent enzyme
MTDQRPLRRAADLALEFLDTIEARHVGATASHAELLAALGGPLPAHGEDASGVVERLAAAADAGLVAISGPRYFGFVIGGSLPAALAADWLTSAWDQNAGVYAAGPAASVVEEVAGGWLIDLLGLPAGSGFGLTTGCQMAHFTCLAAARHAVLGRVGWDDRAQGLIGAPEIDVVVGEEAHATIPTALQYLGLGAERVIVVPTDAQGRMREDALAERLPRGDRPLIVCLQAGNVNTGAFDPLEPLIERIRERPDAWIHIDGAFGLWAAASPELRHLVNGHDRADSWATDGHKWLNVPYDCGYAFVRDATVHAEALAPPSASYIVYGSEERDEFRWVPEYSRRARGFPTYAALRSLGRDGVRTQVERACALARRMADTLRAGSERVEVLNEVVLDQVLVRFEPPDGGDPDAHTRAVVQRVQDDGTCWLSGTTWHGMAAMRISVINWSTTEADIDRSASAILRAAAV